MFVTLFIAFMQCVFYLKSNTTPIILNLSEIKINKKIPIL